MRNMLIPLIVKGISKITEKNRLTVLTYHRVGESYNQLYMNEDLFEQQLIWLKKYFNPMGLDEALILQKSGDLPERAVVLTIDDGYEDCYTKIFPLLKKHHLTATFFISTSGLIRGLLWDELISSSIMTLGIDITELNFDAKNYQLRTHNERLSCAFCIIKGLKYRPLAERNGLIRQLIEKTGHKKEKYQFLNEEKIVTLYKAGMGIGAHTVNHPILVCEDIENAKVEICESKRILEKIIENPVDYFAYPNGKKNIDFNLSHQKIVKECGFKAGFSTDWGSISESDDFYSLNRFTPWDHNEIKFSLRLALNFNEKYTRFRK